MAAPYTVRMAITTCGVNDVAQWNGQTKAQRIASDMFNDKIKMAMDKTMEEIDADFKFCSELPTNHGQICAFIQWSKEINWNGARPLSTSIPSNGYGQSYKEI